MAKITLDLTDFAKNGLICWEQLVKSQAPSQAFKELNNVLVGAQTEMEQFNRLSREQQVGKDPLRSHQEQLTALSREYLMPASH